MKQISKSLPWFACFLWMVSSSQWLEAQSETPTPAPTPAPSAEAQVEEFRQSSWQLATREEAIERIDQWLDRSKLDDDQRDRIRQQLAKVDWAPTGSLDRLSAIIGLMQIAEPRTTIAIESLNQHSREAMPPTLDQLLPDPQADPFVRHHTRLFLGRWLVQNEYYDEAVSVLSALELNEVLDRRTLLFYFALANHQLLRKSDCLEALEKLLEHESTLPTRFSVLSKMMVSDMKPLKDQSLDTISRLMSDIRRRTSFNRSGTTVLNRENEVIDRLDQLIEELEAQQKAQQQSSSPGSSPGGQPMPDSREVNNMGDGKVTKKDIPDGGEWGDLPPAKRAAALAEMAKDMPPHYRTAIEEYFRRLAKENKQQP